MLHWRLVAWSDGEGYRQACALVETYRHLLPKPVTPSQLHGLRNVVTAEAEPQKVSKNFTEHQARKAERRGDPELRDYWKAVGKALDDLRISAKELWSAVGGTDLNLTKRQQRSVLDEIHKQLMQAFVQHMVAHSQYLSVE